MDDTKGSGWDQTRSVVRLAMHMLDTQDGIDMDTYNLLRDVVQKAGSYEGSELLQNVEIASDRAFLSAHGSRKIMEDLKDRKMFRDVNLGETFIWGEHKYAFIKKTPVTALRTENADVPSYWYFDSKTEVESIT